jgi:TolB-like protein
MDEGQYAFGPFVLDPAAGVLRREGQAVALGQRGMALLQALLSAGGQAVSKDELLARAWPGLIVEEANLTVQIAALRKALGPMADGRDWIATVPRVGYRLPRAAALSAAPADAVRPSLAVLPFDNRSSDAEFDYFAEGMVDDIITALSRFRSFAVASRSATIRYKGQRDLREAAQSLGVRYVLEGSVRRRGEQLRVSVTLADAETATQLWAEQFDGSVTRLFEVEDRITEAVVGLVEPGVLRAEVERARRKHPGSLDAYDLYLRALPCFRGASAETRAEAIGLLEQAVALDPGFSTGLAYAAWAYERQDTFGSGMTEAERQRALALAEKAADLGHDDPQVVAIAALVLLNVGGERQRALAMLAEAHRSNPNNPTVLSLFAFANVMAGDIDAGREAFLRALSIAPGALDNYETLVGVGLSHALKREFEASLDWSLRSLAVNSEWPGAYWALAAAYAQLGRMDEARDTVRRLLMRAPGFRVADIERLARRYAERFHVIVDGLRKAGVPD